MASAITEQFNKSRNLSITISVISFVISNIASDKFEKLSLLGVDLSQLNARFIVYCLAMASFISIISLYLTFNNEVLDNVRVKNREIGAETLSEEIKGLFRTCEAAVKGSTAEYEKLLSSNVLKSYFEDCVPLVDDVRLTRQVDAVINDEEISNAVAALKKAIFDNAPFDPASTEYRDFANVRFASIDNLITSKMESLRANMWTNRPPEYAYTARMIGEAIGRQMQFQDAIVPELGRLSKEVRKQRRAMRRESVYLNTEAIVFGLGIPSLLFMISIYHAIIRILGIEAARLPDLFS